MTRQSPWRNARGQACGTRDRLADTGLVIRAATTADLERIQEIEIAAAELFRAIGMDAIADDPPPSAEQLAAYIAAGTAWVATGPEVGTIGYILVDGHAGWSHIEQVTVHPHYARRGVGAALIDHVDERARSQGQSFLSLTTFSRVPWNGPYYESLGFRHLPEPEWPAHFRSLVEREADHGLAAWPRTVMTRTVMPRGVKQPGPGKNHWLLSGAGLPPAVGPSGWGGVHPGCPEPFGGVGN